MGIAVSICACADLVAVPGIAQAYFLIIVFDLIWLLLEIDGFGVLEAEYYMEIALEWLRSVPGNTGNRFGIIVYDIVKEFIF